MVRDSAADAVGGEEVRRAAVVVAAEVAKMEDRAVRREVIVAVVAEEDELAELPSGSLVMESWMVGPLWRGFNRKEAGGVKAWMLLNADRQKMTVVLKDFIMVQVLFV